MQNVASGVSEGDLSYIYYLIPFCFVKMWFRAKLL